MLWFELAVLVVVFGLGVYFAPLLRKDLKAARAAAKDRVLKIVK